MHNSFRINNILVVYTLPIFMLYSLVSDKLIVAPGLDYVIGAVIAILVGINNIENLKVDYSYLLLFLINILFLTITLCFVTVPINRFLLGFLFTYMFAYVFLAYNSVVVKSDDIVLMLKIFYAGMCILSLVLVLMWAYKGWSDIRSPDATPFQSVGATGIAYSATIVFGFSLYVLTRQRRYVLGNIIFIAILSILAIKKSLIMSGIYWLVFIFLYLPRKYRWLALLSVITVVITMLISFGDRILVDTIIYIDLYKKFGVDGVVRLKMLSTGAEIAGDYFPFGSGLGTFCSMPSLQRPYSDIYFDYGFHNLGSLSPYLKESTGKLFLLDTFWAHIIGELGFVGLLLFLPLWTYPIRKAIKFIKSPSYEIRGLALFVVLISISLNIEGIATYTPENITFIMIHGAIFGLCCRHFSDKSIGDNVV